MSVKDQFDALRKNPDFIECFNEFNGTHFTELTESQVFFCWHFVSYRTDSNER